MGTLTFYELEGTLIREALDSGATRIVAWRRDRWSAFKEVGQLPFKATTLSEADAAELLIAQTQLATGRHLTSSEALSLLHATNSEIASAAAHA